VIYLDRFLWAEQQPAVFPVLSDETPVIKVLVASGASYEQVSVIALLQSAPEFMEWFSPPWQRPNQQPFASPAAGLPLAAHGNAVLIPEAAGVIVSLFEGTGFWLGAGGSQISIFAGTAATPRQQVLWNGQGSLNFDFQGISLAAGLGVYVGETAGFATTVFATQNYSRS
ncbi:MAG: hypothetical protein ACRET2_03705, partial [Steroidobacteraceae bacterium]